MHTHARMHTHIFLPYCVYRSIGPYIRPYWNVSVRKGSKYKHTHTLFDLFFVVRLFWLKQFIERKLRRFKHISWLVYTKCKNSHNLISLKKKNGGATVVSFHLVSLFLPIFFVITFLGVAHFDEMFDFNSSFKNQWRVV